MSWLWDERRIFPVHGVQQQQLENDITARCAHLKLKSRERKTFRKTTSCSDELFSRVKPLPLKLDAG